jgi:hypothetical protein
LAPRKEIPVKIKERSWESGEIRMLRRREIHFTCLEWNLDSSVAWPADCIMATHTIFLALNEMETMLINGEWERI